MGLMSEEPAAPAARYMYIQLSTTSMYILDGEYKIHVFTFASVFHLNTRIHFRLSTRQRLNTITINSHTYKHTRCCGSERLHNHVRLTSDVRLPSCFTYPRSHLRSPRLHEELSGAWSSPRRLVFVKNVDVFVFGSIIVSCVV